MNSRSVAPPSPVARDNVATGPLPKQALSEASAALLERALGATSEGITIADARRPDQPIIFANRGFERLTGYSPEAILGRNCRFMQGPDTDAAAVREIRTAVQDGRACTVELLNYRKDGLPFWNRLSITPIHDADGEVTHFIGVQSDITSLRETEKALRVAKRELELANRHMDDDLKAAARVQRALLPERLPDVPEMDFAWVFRPCTQLAGDGLNVVALDDRRYGIYLLDVSGHGAPAALLSVTLAQLLSPIPGQSVLFTSDASSDSGFRLARPAEVAAELNRQFPKRVETRQYFTLFYGVFDAASRELVYVSAGHPAGIYMPREGTPRELPVRGLPVGLVQHPEYEEGRMRLTPGDRLYIYTDGLIEAEDGEEREFGAHRLRGAIEEFRSRPLQESVDAIEAAAERWAGSNLDDDLSIVALEVREGGPADRSGSQDHDLS